MNADTQQRILDAVDDVNHAQKKVLIEKIDKHFGENLKGKTIAIWGLAFKPRTDDIREAPALTLIDFLLSRGAKVRCHDPEAMKNVQAIYGDKIIYSPLMMNTLDGAPRIASGNSLR